MNRLWLGMNLSDAIAAPIVFLDSRNNANFEPGFDKVKKLRHLSSPPVNNIRVSAGDNQDIILQI